MKDKKILALIDGHAIIHRAYHALPPMTTGEGDQVNAVYGFLSMLLKVLEEVGPTHLAVSFDVSKKTFRSEKFEAYKAHRKKADDALYAQIPMIKHLLEKAQIPIFEQEGYEADDVIGTLATQMKSEVDQVVIVSGDKDLLQLVDHETITVFLLKKGMSEYGLYTQAEVKRTFGFSPVQMIDYKALRGDASDNIPGITGVGEKSAMKLIETFGTIEALYAADRSVVRELFSEKMTDKIIEGRADAELSYELATILTDVPGVVPTLEELSVESIDVKAFATQVQRLEFFSLLKRIGSIFQLEGTVVAAPPTVVLDVAPKVVGSDCSFIDAISAIATAETWFVTPEFVSEVGVLPQLQTLVLSTDDAHYYFSWTALSGDEQAQVRALWEGTSLCVGYHLKTLYKWFIQQGINPRVSFFDIKIAFYLIDAGVQEQELASIVKRLLKIEPKKKTDQGTLFGVDPTILSTDAAYIRALYPLLQQALEKESAQEVFETIEMPLVPVLAQMEIDGVYIDQDVLNQLSEEVRRGIDTLSKKIWEEAGEEFNISSSQQLRSILFEVLELPTQGIKKGKTGYSTAASELEKLRPYHDIIQYIEEYRELEKLRNTYIDVLPTLIHADTKRIHTTYNQTVTTTGRLSSSDPNIQNIPIRTALGKEIRNAFIAAEGKTLVAVDYSQIELRIVAHLAQDEALLEIFRSGKDIHAATAAAIHGIPLEEVTPEIRRTAKEVNFGVLYGMGAWGLAARTGLTRGEAKEFIDTYFNTFAGVDRYLKETIAFAEEHGYVETIFGRRRQIRELSASNHRLRQAGERMAVNMPIQGTQADIIKKAMIALFDWIQSNETRQEQVHMILQVHDEIVCEVDKSTADTVAEEIAKIMEGVVSLDVPIIAEAHIGPRWGELK